MNRNMANYFDFDKGVTKTKIAQPPGGFSSISFNWNIDEDKVPIGRSKYPQQHDMSSRQKNVFSNQASLNLLGGVPQREQKTYAPAKDQQSYKNMGSYSHEKDNPEHLQGQNYKNFVMEANDKLYPETTIFHSPTNPTNYKSIDELYTKQKEESAYQKLAPPIEYDKKPSMPVMNAQHWEPSPPPMYQVPQQQILKETPNKFNTLEGHIDRKRIRVAQPPGKILI